jgi:hypothetical protein
MRGSPLSYSLRASVTGICRHPYRITYAGVILTLAYALFIDFPSIVVSSIFIIVPIFVLNAWIYIFPSLVIHRVCDKFYRLKDGNFVFPALSGGDGVVLRVCRHSYRIGILYSYIHTRSI